MLTANHSGGQTSLTALIGRIIKKSLQSSIIGLPRITVDVLLTVSTLRNFFSPILCPIWCPLVVITPDIAAKSHGRTCGVSWCAQWFVLLLFPSTKTVENQGYERNPKQISNALLLPKQENHQKWKTSRNVLIRSGDLRQSRWSE